MNYFDPKSVAERYARGRPYFHPLVIERVKAYLFLDKRVEHAIDAGCGTGLSTIALKEIAEAIVGVDKSEEMLSLAPPDPQIRYLAGLVEDLPVGDSDFDLMTLSSVFHWLNRSAFLAEVRRVLRPRGWLVIYDNYFTGRMSENPHFSVWWRKMYLRKYLSPPREPTRFGAEESGKDGFSFLAREDYENLVTFILDSLVNYLLTQSNIIAAVEGGNESVGDVSDWLTENIRPLFGNRTEATFLFRGPIWYLIRAA